MGFFIVIIGLKKRGDSLFTSRLGQINGFLERREVSW